VCIAHPFYLTTGKKNPEFVTVLKNRRGVARGLYMIL
jgi:hypothetical protein